MLFTIAQQDYENPRSTRHWEDPVWSHTPTRISGLTTVLGLWIL